jgi:hypothetical protein
MLSVHGLPRLYFEPLKLLNFAFDAVPDPDPAFHSNAVSAWLQSLIIFTTEGVQEFCGLAG